jgi:hypothetical protein
MTDPWSAIPPATIHHRLRPTRTMDHVIDFANSIQKGISPHRMRTISLSLVSRFRRTMG